MNFHDWYAQMYPERWEGLYSCLLDDPPGFALREGLQQPYYLDEASLQAALALDVHPGHTVLDACAAPGGKTLVLALHLAGTGELTANDRSSSRRSRLHRVLRGHLSEEHRCVITVTGHDAARWGLYEQDRFDRILLDVPCSSERHVLNNPRELAKWSSKRSRRLAVQQFAMAAAALDAVKPGGRIIYSTCSISMLENDQVMEKLLKRRAGRCRVTVPSGIPWGEPTEYGWMILPDQCGGRGPLYISVITKVPQEESDS